MSIKNDRWIKQMAERHGMIDPYEPGLVSHDKNGRKIVSYGTSSYGYDVRCAREFKVFTNINSAIVDEQLCPRPHRRILPYPARHPHHLPRQKHLRPLRHHCECHPA